MAKTNLIGSVSLLASKFYGCIIFAISFFKSSYKYLENVATGEDEGLKDTQRKTTWKLYQRMSILTVMMI